MSEFFDQLPDTDPDETGEWLDALDAVVARAGAARAKLLLTRLNSHARHVGVDLPKRITTPYVNTIPTEAEPWFPGDLAMERRIRRLIRWNAAAMVVRANQASEGIGGHLSTFASSAALYEVGMNWFFRGHGDGVPGDHVYFQGHAAPGVYARAYLEGRLDDHQLDHYRRETGGGGLSSYPHPRLMPHFWEHPTVSMGLGPLMSIHHARFLRYLAARHLDATADSRVWCFVGDGECDEPETLAGLALAAREGLDNLTWVVNCNLQRLDGPVRGNAKIIQELEAEFRGAGWNVVKVIWGSRWDSLLAADVDGVLMAKMNATPDGDFQRYAVSDGAHIRDHFFGPDPRLRAMVEHLSDDDLRGLPRGGHDYAKIYAAYDNAVHTPGVPTVVLAKTVKGWMLGNEVQARNATHQMKKLAPAQLTELAERLELTDQLDMAAVGRGEMPYLRPGPNSDEAQYLHARRQALDGFVPTRVVTTRRPLVLPSPGATTELDRGSGDTAVSTTGAFTRLLRNLLRDPDFGPRVVPIVPDEARTFGMDALFREFRIYAPGGQRYQPVDHELLLSYTEDAAGQILEEGINEAGATASWIAAGTAYATRGVPMVPFYTFYSMFGFQRVGDLLWAAADARTRGFLLGATAGRTTLAGEGLQHADGHSQLLAATVPACRAYDPAFAFEVAAIVRGGLARMYPATGNAADGADEFYYLTLYNEPINHPARPAHVTDDDILAGIYRLCDAEAPGDAGGGDGSASRLTVSLLFSGAAYAAAVGAKDLLAEHGVAAELWSVPGWKQVRDDALAVTRHNRLHPDDIPRQATVTAALSSATGPVVAVTDWMCAVPDQLARFVPARRRYVSLGTDGFGLSDDRRSLRRYFEVDAAHVAAAALSALAADGVLDPRKVAATIAAWGLTGAGAPPWQR